MSRFGDLEYDYDGRDTSGLYAANLRRALTGKRGRQALADLRDALLALPEKRLIEGALCTVGIGGRIAAMPETVMREVVEPVKDADGNWVRDTTGMVLFEPPHLQAATNYARADLEEFVAEHDAEPEGVCAVGAYIWWQKVKAGADPAEAFDELPVLPDTEGGPWETADAGRAAGLAGVLAWELAWLNDETWGSVTPETRHQRFLKWLDEQLAEPAVAQ